MAVSRRSFVTSVAAGSALAAVSTTELVSALTSPAFAASPPGDVVGKIRSATRVGSPATGDGAPINGWWHWSNNWGQPPSPGNNAIVSWPDMRDYTRSYPTAYPNLGNGQPATLFSSVRPADRGHALPVDAGERLRHRGVAAVQPVRR